MGHILAHDCLHTNNDTGGHLAILHVNEMDKKRKRAQKGGQISRAVGSFHCVEFLRVVRDAFGRSRA